LSTNIEDLRRYYASLSDDALLAIERGDLTEDAQRCYDEEVSERQIASEEPGEPTEADWIETAMIACSFGDRDLSDLEEACKIMEDAGIPYDVKTTEGEYTLREVLVPAAQQLLALSVLDSGLFNPRQEADWKAHFGELSEEDFDAIRIDDLTAGMADRIERLKRAYDEERVRRGQ